jgi:ferritin
VKLQQIKNILAKMINLINENIAGPAANSELTNPVILAGDSVKLLTERLGDEYAAHYFYNSAANWCAGAGYLKAADFFASESKNELEHAHKLQKYMVDWNVHPVIPKVDTHHDFGTLPGIIDGAYKIEYALFQKYVQNSHALFMSDLATFDFLQEFRQIQTESVAEYSDLLNALQLIDIDKRLDLLHFEEMYLAQ